MTRRGLNLTEVEYAAMMKRRKTGAPVAKSKPTPSKLEERFMQQLSVRGFQQIHHLVDTNLQHNFYYREYYFIVGRDFRFDFAWPQRRIAVEIQGAAHRIKGKFKADIEKRALAVLNGWLVLELDGDAIRSERGIQWFIQLFGAR